MRRLAILCLATAACGVNEAKVEQQPMDLGEEGAELSASIPLVKLGEHQQAVAIFDSTTHYAAYEFFGHAGDKVSIYVDGAKTRDLDTTVALYKVSFISGRPYGSAIAYDDDTADTSWTSNAYASSIDGFTLPQDRNYAMVVSTYGHVAGTASVLWMQDRAIGSLTWPGSGAGTAITLHPQAATLLPMSAALNDAMSHFAYGPGHTEAARLKLAPATLAATFADSNAAPLFAYEMLYNNRGQDPSMTPVAADLYAITQASAVTQLESAANISDLGADTQFTDQTIRAVLAAMFGDGKFATSSVKVYRLHSDNGDDMSAEAIMAADLTSGEVRVLGLYSDP